MGQLKRWLATGIILELFLVDLEDFAEELIQFVATFNS
jgi:hypothetical protein